MLLDASQPRKQHRPNSGALWKWRNVSPIFHDHVTLHGGCILQDAETRGASFCQLGYRSLHGSRLLLNDCIGRSVDVPDARGRVQFELSRAHAQ